MRFGESKTGFLGLAVKVGGVGFGLYFRDRSGFQGARAWFGGPGVGYGGLEICGFRMYHGVLRWVWETRERFWEPGMGFGEQGTAFRGLEIGFGWLCMGHGGLGWVLVDQGKGLGG